MNTHQLQRIIEEGENESVEFKRCGNQPEKDLFETICAFANTCRGRTYHRPSSSSGHGQ